MSVRTRSAVAASALVLAASSLAMSSATAATPASARAGSGGSAASPAASATGQAHWHRVCAQMPAGFAACHALLRDDVGGSSPAEAKARKRPTSSTPSGYGPGDIRSAYGLTSASSGGAVVAIVDAYDDPTAESDLGVYRKQFGLAPCTTANGCFTKVDQRGGKSYPNANGGWAQEISLDLDMVSAACPDCRILLVEADSSSFANLAAGVDTAAAKGAVAISNSYGGSDMAEISSYVHPGIAITASSGDNGYGVEAPASFTHVVAVGGTSLTKSGSTWSESAWSGAGSGCSTKNAAGSQKTSVTGCSGKATADVSAVADPQTGVAVYDSTAYQGRSGWLVFGGTSASSPIIASVFALGGVSGDPVGTVWGASSSSFHDVTSGSNGTCSPALWCHAGTGWDGPTGLGTPNGTAGF